MKLHNLGILVYTEAMLITGPLYVHVFIVQRFHLWDLLFHGNMYQSLAGIIQFSNFVLYLDTIISQVLLSPSDETDSIFMQYAQYSPVSYFLSI